MPNYSRCKFGTPFRRRRSCLPAPKRGKTVSATWTRSAESGRERAEPPYLYPVAAGQPGRHLLEHGRRRALPVTLAEVRVAFGQARDRLRHDHRSMSPLLLQLRRPRSAVGPLRRRSEGADPDRRRQAWLPDDDTQNFCPAVGIDERAFRHGDHARSRAVGAAAYFLEMDGLIVPSARSACTNLVLFPDRTSAGVVLQVEERRELDWLAWRETVAAAKIASPPGS